MALVIENGTGLENADAYVSVAEVDTYAANYGKVGWSDLSTPNKEIKIRQATQFVDNVYMSYLTPLRIEQRLFVPATNLNLRGTMVEGVPVQLKDAVCELSCIAVSVSLVEAQNERLPTQRTVKVGDISKSETFSNSFYKKIFHPVEMILRPFISGYRSLGDGVSQVTMVRS